MHRPRGITVTAILMAANPVCDVTLSLTAPGISNANIRPTGPSMTMIFVHIALVAYIIVQLAAIPFYWLGRIWARWAILVGCLYYIVSLRTLSADWHRGHDIAYLDMAAGMLAFYLLWYLHTERVREWFASPKRTA